MPLPMTGVRVSSEMPALSFQTAIQPSMRGESVRMTLRWKLPSGSFSSLCVLLKGVSLRLRAVTAFVKRKESSTLRLEPSE